MRMIARKSLNRIANLVSSLSTVSSVDEMGVDTKATSYCIVFPLSMFSIEFKGLMEKIPLNEINF